MAAKGITKTKGPQYKIGDAVWARMDGFPWWPGRVVTRDDVIVDDRDEEPIVDAKSRLVEFFNDNKRFAVIARRWLRPFNDEYLQINKTYNGSLFSTLNDAIREAKEYIAERGEEQSLEYRGSRDSLGGRRSEGGKDGTHEDTNSKNRPGQSAELKENPKEQEERVKPRKKGEKQRTENDKKRKKEKKDDGDESVRKKRKRKAEEIQNANEDNFLTVEKKESDSKPSESTPASDLPNTAVPRKSKRRKSESSKKEKDQDQDQKKVKEERKAAKTEVKAKEIHAKREDNELKEHEERIQKAEGVIPARRRDVSKDESGGKRGEGKNGTPESREAVPKKKKLERGTDNHEDKGEKGKLKPAAGHKTGKRRKDLKPESLDNYVSLNKPTDDKEFKDGDPYRNLSKEQLVELVRAYEKQNRSLRLQVWRWKLQSLDKSNIVTTMKDFIRKCAPGFNAVHKMIESYEQEQTKEEEGVEETEADKEKRRAEKEGMEGNVCEQIESLIHVHFDPAILKIDPKILFRAMKLATKVLPYSIKVGRVMRELIVQWVDMVAVENMSSEQSGKGENNGRKYSALNPNEDSLSAKRGEEEKDERSMEVEGESDREEKKNLNDMNVERAQRTGRPADVVEAEIRGEGGDTSSNDADEYKIGRDDEDMKEVTGGSAGELDEMRKEGKANGEGPGESEEQNYEEDDERGRVERGDSNEEIRVKQDDDKDKSPAKSERRVAEFTRERCTDTIKYMLTPFAGRNVQDIEMTNLKLEELAEDLERAIEPKREDDKKRYFEVSKKVLKLLNGSKEAKDAALQVAVKRNAREFVQKCIDGAFPKDKVAE